MISSFTSAYKTVNRYFDVSFVVKFLVLFAVCYYANMYFVDLVIPGKSYNAFIDKNLNYIDWITSSIMHAANFITRSVGLDTRVEDTRYFIAESGNRLVMGWQCVGLGILSFWTAFVIANNMSRKKKFLWLVSGFLVVWLLNFLRAALLMIALESNVRAWKKEWTIFRGLDHHDLFNYACYALLIGLIYLFYRKFSVKG